LLMQKATPEMVEKWRSAYAEFRPVLAPNRKPASELIKYLTSKYPVTELTGDKFKKVVIGNVVSNKCFAEKLPEGRSPLAVCYVIDNAGNGRSLYEKQDDIFRNTAIFVGVELETGYFLVEGCSALWDELFAFQGLDESDLNNFYLVAEYIDCLRKFNMLDDVLMHK
jgi:hypothetical protein